MVGYGSKVGRVGLFVKVSLHDYDSVIKPKYCINLGSCNKPKLGLYNDIISRLCLLHFVFEFVRWLADRKCKQKTSLLN